MGKDALFMNPIDESARLQRVAVIEWRMPWACDGEMRGTEWYLHAVLTDRNSKEEMDERCSRLSQEFYARQFRWRYGFLTLEPSDKCEIFKYDDNEKKEKKEKNG